MPTFPVLEKTWLDPHYYLELPAQANGTLTNSFAFLALKNGLLGLSAHPWVCKGSSDSTTAGMDGVDRLTDTSKIVANAAGAHSWIVLRNVDGLEILCDFGVSAAYAMKVQMSVSAGFTGGSTTVTPTATDQELCVPTAAGAGNDRWLFDGTSTVARLHLHIMHSTDGRNTMAFIMYGGVIQAIWVMGRASSPVYGWTNPLIAYIDGIFTNGTSTTMQAYTRLQTRAQIMSHVGSHSIPMAVHSLGWSANMAPGNMFFAEANSGKWQLWGMGLNCFTSPTIGVHGRIMDVWRVPASVPSGWIFRSPDDSVALINLGTWVVPYSKNMAAKVI